MRGPSHNIWVCIIGRFLKHTRIFIFCLENGGTPDLYLASADWMPRPLHPNGTHYAFLGNLGRSS
jgi:polyphosphate kinase